MVTAPTRDDRIQGGSSLHDHFDRSTCPRENISLSWSGIRCGPWRVVDCCKAQADRDVEECARCGRQQSVRCSFDEEYK